VASFIAELIIIIINFPFWEKVYISLLLHPVVNISHSPLSIFVIFVIPHPALLYSLDKTSVLTAITNIWNLLLTSSKNNVVSLCLYAYLYLAFTYCSTLLKTLWVKSLKLLDPVPATVASTALATVAACWGELPAATTVSPPALPAPEISAYSG